MSTPPDQLPTSDDNSEKTGVRTVLEQHPVRGGMPVGPRMVRSRRRREAEELHRSLKERRTGATGTPGLQGDAQPTGTGARPQGPVQSQTSPQRPTQPPRPGITRRPRAVGGLSTAANRPKPITVDFNKGITLKRGLKGGDDKKTCLLDIGGTTYVVKGGSGNVEDHVAASQFIGKLRLPGVQAPACRTLNDNEKATIVGAMPADQPDAQQLAKSLQMLGPDQQTSGLISELAQGKPFDKIFPSKASLEALAGANDVRAEADTKTADQVWAAACEKAKTLEKRPFFSKGIDERKVMPSDPAKRKQVLDWFRSNLVSPRMTALIEVLEEIDRGGVAEVKSSLKKLEKEADELEKERQALESFAKSPEGIDAFAGVAVVDLITGMDDRLLTKVNGGNFLFDAQTRQLCCVDNAKAPDIGLNADDSVPWQQQFLANNMKATGAVRIEDMLFERVYGDPGDGNDWLPGAYVKFADTEAEEAKRKIREVLNTVVQKVEADDDAGDAASSRVAFLKHRLALEEVFRIDPKLAKPADKPKGLNPAEKLVRRAAKALGKDEEELKATQDIKNGLRDGTLTPAQAKQQLKALQAQSKSLVEDHRSAKIEFLSDVAMFRGVMAAKTQALLTLKKQAPEAWKSLQPDRLGAEIQAAFERWLAMVGEKDKKDVEEAWRQWKAAIAA